MPQVNDANDTLNFKLVKLINELYRSFNFFNHHFCKNELDEPIITIQGDKRKGSTYGWFGKDFWEESQGVKAKKVNEINLTAESLHRDYNEVLGTLLHEMRNGALKKCTKRNFGLQ